LTTERGAGAFPYVRQVVLDSDGWRVLVGSVER